MVIRSADQIVDKWNDFKDVFLDISNNCAPILNYWKKKSNQIKKMRKRGFYTAVPGMA